MPRSIKPLALSRKPLVLSSVTNPSNPRVLLNTTLGVVQETAANVAGYVQGAVDQVSGAVQGAYAALTG